MKGECCEQVKGLDVTPIEHITQSILVLRGHRVLLDTEPCDALRGDHQALQ